MKSRLLKTWKHGNIGCWLREVIRDDADKWYCGYVECGFAEVVGEWSFSEIITYTGDIAELLHCGNSAPVIGFDTQDEAIGQDEVIERINELAEDVAELNGKVFALCQPERSLNFAEFMENVIDWASNKHLLIEPNADTKVFEQQVNIKRSRQLLKFHEECGELTEDYLKGNAKHIVDSFGDVLVTLVIFAKQMDIPLDKCWNKAWSHIKNRTGKTIHGTFVKDGDM
ncbi:hypothetical protein ACI3E1_06160 [Ligilactobacillus sp. LYQ139]|uniref:hypothetical protein n=1 Tax=Ligilactobacillus sp. LYQ139 TaxID=3378800 RepID=UPI0038535768